jgi:hypothetical protein
MRKIRFHDIDCIPLTNGALNLLVSQSIGLRILSLHLHGEANLFAELPGVEVIRSDGKVYRHYGGHRLWVAPEVMPHTYTIDDSPVEILPIPSGLAVIQNLDLDTGIQKSMRIELIDALPQVRITHILANLGSTALECAPWAITQLRTGGVVLLPQNRLDTGLLPNRSLVSWPYTDLSNANLHFGTDFIWFHARMDSPFKLGFPNPRGWLAYWLDGTVYVKRARYESGAAYYDFGSSSECYCNNLFLELETLAPVHILPPGASVTHVETWEVHRWEKYPQDGHSIQSLIAGLKLDEEA